MQITFDTTNPQDLEILKAILPKFAPHHPGADTQPAVVNTGSNVPAITQHSGDVAVSGADTAPAPVKKRGRTKPEIRDVEQAEAAVEQEETPENEEIPAVELAPAAVEQVPAEVAIPYTIDDVRAALQAFTAKAGIDGGIQLLKNFGAQRISELKASDYAAFVGACQ